MTEWMSADELAKQIKLGDLLEFKGTKQTTMFHHWSICVKINTQVAPEKRTAANVKMLQLSRIGTRAISGSDLFNFGVVFVSAKVKNEILLQDDKKYISSDCFHGI
jgi:hypothetical protein